MGRAIHGSAQKKPIRSGVEKPTSLLSSKRSIGCSLNPRLAHRLVDIHRPPPPPPIGPLPTKEKRVVSSHSAHEAPLIQIHQSSGVCVTSSPPPLMIVPMMNVIVPLAAAFQSLQDTSSVDRRRPSTVGVWWWCWYFWCLRAETISGIGGGGVGIGGVGNGRVSSIRSGRIWL